MSENAFGILVNRFHVLAKYIHLGPTKCTIITNECIALYNFLLPKEMNAMPQQKTTSHNRCVEIWLIREVRETTVADSCVEVW